MAALTVQERQILSLIRTLPLDRRRLLLSELAQDSKSVLPRTTTSEEAELRSLAMDKGLDWDKIADEQRMDLVADLLHEED